MNLSFSEKINGKPTYFIESIWVGLRLYNTQDVDNVFDLYNHYRRLHIDQFNTRWDRKITGNTFKVHTIREDKSNRWHVGSKIHFIINNRSKDRFQFAPVMEVKSIQKISICYIHGKDAFPLITISKDEKGGVSKTLSPVHHFNYITELSELAFHDGFDSWEEFLQYFNEDFSGKIIHWTDIKY